jgi:ribosomal-protein-alanine N-acetyltransferase
VNSPGEARIRTARAEDLDAILLLDRTLDTLPHWPVAEYRAAIAGTDAMPLRCLFVAELDGKIAGLAVGRLDRIAGECSGELESVGVALSAQRKGIGRELCRAVIGWVGSKGASHLDLEVRSCSTGAITLYRQLGFVAAGTRPGYYRNPEDDAVLMRLDLEQQRSEPASSAE